MKSLHDDSLVFDGPLAPFERVPFIANISDGWTTTKLLQWLKVTGSLLEMPLFGGQAASSFDLAALPIVKCHRRDSPAWWHVVS